MDGSIELKSKAGVGTTVIVKIPFKIGTQDKNSNLSDRPVSLDAYSVEGMPGGFQSLQCPQMPLQKTLSTAGWLE